jgi:hypothetical protein
MKRVRKKQHSTKGRAMTTVAFLSNPMAPPTDRFFVPAGPSETVVVIRHTYDCFEVVAYGFWGQICRHRMYSYGKSRRVWAIEQAQQWADEMGLWFGGVIVD